MDIRCLNETEDEISINFKEHEDSSNVIKMNDFIGVKKLHMKCPYQWPVDHMTYEDFSANTSNHSEYLIQKKYEIMNENLKNQINLKQSNFQIIKLIKNNNTDTHYLFWIINLDYNDISVFFCQAIDYLSFSSEGELIGNNSYLLSIN